MCIWQDCMLSINKQANSLAACLAVLEADEVKKGARMLGALKNSFSWDQGDVRDGGGRNRYGVSARHALGR